MTQSNLDYKIQNYIDDLFSDVGKSQDLFEIKEELTTNLKEKVADYQKQGFDEDAAFRESIISMGDLSGLVDDMKTHGQKEAKDNIYSNRANRISMIGFISSGVLILFGLFISLALYFMGLPDVTVVGPSIFIVIGGALIIFSSLTRETSKKYGMDKLRTFLFTLSGGIILFGFFTAVITGIATGELPIAFISSLAFFIAGIGLFIGSILTGKNRRKE
ncbi:permease prefix domain 1-containing protein [Barrientosiimonas marina]|uniref:Permease prefix domain 1-containing protein n=1 Tax=Lentibacillus kimchii TaxID=1542911 RepID=A0ABW2UT41_9BACI